MHSIIISGDTHTHETIKYGEDTNNPLFTDLVIQYSKSRRHSAELDEKMLSDLFKTYQKQVGTLTNTSSDREPAGKVTQISKTTQHSLSDQFFADQILSDSTTAEQIRDKYNGYLDFLDNNDDTIEDPESAELIGLNIQTSSIRPTR